MKKFASVLLVVAAVSGCAAVRPILADALAVVSHDSEVIGAAERIADSFFIAAPNPELQKKVNSAIERARLALAAATAALRGAQNLTDHDVNNALNEFRSAYHDLVRLLEGSGIVSKPGTFAAAGTGAPRPQLPPALALERFTTKR